MSDRNAAYPGAQLRLVSAVLVFARIASRVDDATLLHLHPDGGHLGRLDVVVVTVVTVTVGIVEHWIGHCLPSGFFAWIRL